VSYTNKEAIDKEYNNLNRLMREFDVWASKNPSKLVICTSVSDENYEKGKEYRSRKQDIKVSRLKIRELEKKLKDDQNTPRRKFE